MFVHLCYCCWFILNYSFTVMFLPQCFEPSDRKDTNISRLAHSALPGIYVNVDWGVERLLNEVYVDLQSALYSEEPVLFNK